MTTTKTTATTNQLQAAYNNALSSLRETTLKASLKLTEAKIEEMEAQYKDFYKEYNTQENK